MPPHGLEPAMARLAIAADAWWWRRWWQQSRTAALCAPPRQCCARRGLAQSAARLQAAPPPSKPDKPGAGASLDPRGRVDGTPIDAPRSYGRRVEGGFTPKPLPRPIGMPRPPRAGENTGIDSRTLKERRDDFVDYDKHMQRRKEL